jgi:hypothetical protein
VRGATCEVGIPLRVQQDVLRLDVPVQHLHRVDVREGGAEASHVKRHVPLGKNDLLAQVVAEVAAGLEVEDEVHGGPGCTQKRRRRGWMKEEEGEQEKKKKGGRTRRGKQR